MKWLVSVRLSVRINICGGIGGKVDSTLAVGAELGVVGWVQEGSEEQHCFHATVLL